jgi:predicted RNase H-like nuclease (RuvC/YqgF family)
MRINLRINKEIIDEFYKNQSVSNNTLYISKLKEEIINLTTMNDNLKKEIQNLMTKLTLFDNIRNETQNFKKETIESLKNKIFILENVIIKKDTAILNLKYKLNNIIEREEKNIIIEKEVYVIIFLYR